MTGAAGAAGMTGVAGTTGSAGAAGTTGTAGAAGTTGTAGAAGTTGRRGGGAGTSSGGRGNEQRRLGGFQRGRRGGSERGRSRGDGWQRRGRGASRAPRAAAGSSVYPMPGSYRLTCDGSMAVMIDATHFLDGNDEQQGMRLYASGSTGTPLATIDISTAIGLTQSDEADLEDAARIGDRIYAIGSHGRNKSGKQERARYRFFAMDLSGASPNIALSVPGYTTALLDQLLLAPNWNTPDDTVLATLTAASSLSRATDATLAPLAGGTNIEGLAWLPTASRPDQLLIGFRSPLQSGKAIVVSLLNADAVVAGVNARFGEAILLDLGGLSIRGMAWSAAHDAVLMIGGPLTDAAGPFRLFKWSGAAADLPDRRRRHHRGADYVGARIDRHLPGLAGRADPVRPGRPRHRRRQLQGRRRIRSGVRRSDDERALAAARASSPAPAPAADRSRPPPS